MDGVRPAEVMTGLAASAPNVAVAISRISIDQPAK
jgi:hypothetical protein